ncbi:DUF4047 domain-containing protein [Bacillus sp. FJAT-53711]|uniref:DUF4047 domain-containing protein n=1 Tax=Bacillus yunxiaonensis TaxID=3127665 RepID=A0ABU8FW74_9BACI
MKKPTKKVRNMLILPCVCSIAFYMGSQVVTYTEASFSNQQTVEATLSTATVFPKTIEKLTEEARQHREAAFNHYNVISSGANSHATVAELESKLATWKQNREAIQTEIAALGTIYTEIESYYNKVVEETQAENKESTQAVFKYVQAGFTTIQSIHSDVDKQAISQKADEKIRALEKQINEEKTKQENEKQKQANEKQKQPSAQPETSSQQEQQLNQVHPASPKSEESKEEGKPEAPNLQETNQ